MAQMRDKMRKDFVKIDLGEGINMYRVLYKPYNAGYQMSDEMTLKEAKDFRDKCLKLHYLKENVHIIQIVE